MAKLKRLLSLNDPPPTPWYEISCYLKGILGTIFFILGILLIFYPLFTRTIFGVGLTPAGEKITKFFTSTLWPKGNFGLLFWGLVCLGLGGRCFSEIKIIKKLFNLLR